jgi:RNA polymerase sigma-70 factor (ECF subfamily)
VDAVLSAPLAGQPADVRAGLFDRLVAHELDGAYRLAAVILGDALEAEDAVHDAAVAAWRSFGSLRDPARFDAWFGRILINGCRDRLRRRHRTPIVDLGAVVELLADDRKAADMPAGAAERNQIARALARLDPDHRVVLVLRFWLDCSVATIAERLEIPLGTAKSRLHHAQRRLRQALDDEDRR